VFRKILRKIRGQQCVSRETFVSFKPYLTVICRRFQPRLVLEFGPGNSTAIILENTTAHIISIEESKKWYRKYHSKFPRDRVELYYKQPGWDLCELNSLGGPYNLIVVDGGNRTAELKHCTDLLTPDGIVFLHDAHREEYEPGIRTYPHIFFPERHSCLMCKSSDIMAQIKTIITPDLSCRCRYCNTDVRNRYLAQFTQEM